MVIIDYMGMEIDTPEDLERARSLFNIYHSPKLLAMTKFRNFKMVGYVVYGRGSFNQLDEILAPQQQKRCTDDLSGRSFF